MADIDRRTVRPAHPDAYIPDPARRDRLPPEGAEVTWSHYWQAHLDKGNVVPVEPERPATPVDPPPPAAKPLAPRSPASAGDPAH